MKDVEIIGMLKSYVQKSLVGVGALKGAPCKIQSITDGDGFHTVKFEWTDDAGTSHTSDMIVNDGSDIASITQDGATITVELSDGTSHDFIVPTLQGPKGDKGDKGDTGAGVPEGGTAGQVLVKKSSTDYDTEWDTPAGGGDMLKSVYDTDNDGKVDSAENADKVNGHTVAEDVPADAKFTDTVYDDTEIRGEIDDKVDKVSGKGLSTEDYTSAEKTKLGGIETGAEVNTIESITLNGTEVTPDANKNVALTVITKAVNDLVNYYLKSETYSKTEVDDIVTAIKNSRFEVVATLPTTDIKTNVIYLVPKSPSQTSNVKDEYINLDGTTSGWEKIGDTEIDLSDYVTTQALNTALANYTTTADLTTLLAAKQDTLTFDNAPTENSNNPVKSGGVYADEKAIYEVMGQNGAKNLNSYPYYDITRTQNGITFTDNGDGTITVDGTASGDAYFTCHSRLDGQKSSLVLSNGRYILSGSPSGASVSGAYLKCGRTYDDTYSELGAEAGSGATITLAGDDYSEDSVRLQIQVTVKSGTVVDNLVFKPMIRLASIQDDTWVPYVPTNKELMSCKLNGYVGAKNLLPYPYKNTTKSENGVTFIDNGDGTITVNTPTSASAETTFYLSQSIQSILDTGMYILSGCPSGGNRTSGYFMEFAELTTSSSNWKMFGTDTGEGAIAHIDSTRYVIHAYIRIRSGATVSNLTFKPMIRRVEDTDPTWQPYAKTNKELTEDVESARLLQDAVTQHITVTADGTKTVQTLMNELHTALASIISTLDSSETLHVIGARSDGGTWFRPSNVELKYNNNNTLSNVSMDSFTVTTGQNCYIYSVTFSSTLATNTFRQMSILTSGNTFTYRTNDVPTSGTQWIMTYQIYKTV